MMKLLHISDNHRYFSDNLPDADILCHTGDYSLLHKEADLKSQINELQQFNNWLGTIKHNYQYILYTSGNHDIIFEREPKLAQELLSNAITLNDKAIKLLGYNFYGTPSQPKFCNWAFNFSNSARRRHYMMIPDNTDILMTHCPPHGILDKVVAPYSPQNGSNVGCPILKSRVEVLKPKVHLFGHLHSNCAIITMNETKFSNACLMDDYYKPNGTYNIIELD